jgi:hypothetical protein
LLVLQDAVIRIRPVSAPSTRCCCQDPSEGRGVRGQKSVVRDQKSEIRTQKTEYPASRNQYPVKGGKK